MSSHERARPHRDRAPRLRCHDYIEGWYFVTLCVSERRCLFGDNADGRMVHSPLGNIVLEEWRRIEVVREDAVGHEVVVMPNHVHGVVEIVSVEGPGRRSTLGNVVGGFKSAVTARARRELGVAEVWQASFHDRIIRSAEELRAILKYMEDNPGKWEEDRFHPGSQQRRS